jgi:long-chain acyl-CoA synthetase
MEPCLRTLADFPALLAGRGAAPAILAMRAGSLVPTASAALADSARRLAGALAALGVGRGAPVLLFGPASADWITVRLGLAAAGAVAVALDDAASDAELAVLVPDSGAGIAFAQSTHVARLAAVAPHLAVWSFDAPPEGVSRWTRLAEGPRAAPPAVQPSDPAMLVYTSGTTGTPKSFHLTHANILHNVHALAAQRIATEADRLLLPLPLHHVYPLTVGVFCPLAIGAPVVLPEGADAPRIAAAMQAAQVSLVIGVPRLYSALAAGIRARAAARGRLAAAVFNAMLGVSLFVRRRTGMRIGRHLFGQVHRAFGGRLRVLASGGAKPDIEAVWVLEGLGFECLSGYGLAETASILTNQPQGSAVIGTEGRPLPGVQLRIADPGPDGTGEVQARGPSVFAGYRAPPGANEAAFTADGWFRTGDLGRLDPDGNLVVTGRVKEMIVLGGGKNVFPEEVEKALARPEFKEIAVTEKAGALVALVLPDLARIGAGPNTRAADVVRVALTEAARALPHWQRPAGVALVREPLPRTRLGKYRRFQLPALYDAALEGRAGGDAGAWTEPDQAMLATPAGSALIALLAQRAKGKKVGPETSPALELGLDSLGFLELSMALEGRTGIALSEEDVAAVETVRDLLARVVAKQGAPPHETAAAAPDPHWLAPRSVGERAIGFMLRGLNGLLMRVAFSLNVSGREHLPDGKVIVCANHLSDLDPLVIAAALPRESLARVRWSGDAGRLFGSRAGRFLARATRIFPVEERRPALTLAYARAVLEAGDCLVWFPESWRSPDGALQAFLPGIGRLVRETGAPVVPAHISGTFEAMPRTARLPRPHPVRVAFGPPVAAATLLADGADDATVAARIRGHVAALAP